jgi:hypothetical protein
LIFQAITSKNIKRKKKMEDETSTEDSQEEEIENPLTKKTRNKEEETTPKKTEEEELFHSALFKNKKFVNALQKIEIDPSCEGCFYEKMERERTNIWRMR